MTAVVPLSGVHLEPLKSFENAVSSVNVTGDLIASTRRAFQHIEPWAHAQTILLHPTVRDIVVDVKEHALLYFSAIDMSIETSRAGANFADDAITLCEAIMDEAPTSSILAFINDMQQVASRAHEDAENMLQKFRTVRQGFFNITKNISQATDKVYRATQKAQASQRRHERGRAIAAAFGGAVLQANNAVGAASGLASLDGGCLAIIIPVILPIMSFLASKIEDGCASKADARRTTALSCMEASMQLERIGDDMDGLLKHINFFSTWWSNMSSVLNSLKSNVSHLDISRVEGIQRKWLAVQKQYHTYGVEISALQDFYPALYHRSKLHLSNGLSIRLEPTVSSLAAQVEQCRVAIHSLHLASLHSRCKYSARLRSSLDEITPHYTYKWAYLIDHLKLVVEFGQNLADAYEHPESGTQEIDTRAWSLAVDELARTSRSAVDGHAAIIKLFDSQKDVIAKCLVKSASFWKAKKVHHAARKSIGGSSDDEAYHQPIDYVGKRLDILQDGLKTLTSLETILADITVSLQETASFWKARSTGPLSTQSSSSSSSIDLHGQTFTVCDFEPIDHQSISASKGSIVASLDALVAGIPDASVDKENKEHFLPRLPGWLRT